MLPGPSPRVSFTRVFLSVVVGLASPVRGQDGGVQAVPVASAVLTPPAQAEPIHVGPGLYLPERLALERATELEACRVSRPAGPAAPVANSTPVAVAVAFGLGVLLGGVAVAFVAVRLQP